MWPRNKMTCLIKQLLFFGLRTYGANKWGQGLRFCRPKILWTEWLCCGFRAIWLSAPSTAGAPSHLCFTGPPLITAASTKRRGCLELLCCPCTLIHWQSNGAASQSHTAEENRGGFNNLTPLRIRFQHNLWKSSGFKWSVASITWSLDYNGKLLLIVHSEHTITKTALRVLWPLWDLSKQGLIKLK